MENQNSTNQHEFHDSKWYSTTGRISRLQFAGSVLLCLIPQMICKVVLASIYLMVLFSGGAIFEDNLQLAIIVGMVSVVIFIFVSIYGRIIYPMRRLHDLNQSGWLALLALIPYVGYAFLLYLAIVEGSEEDNQYGKPPKPNTTIHYIVFYTALALLVFGLIASSNNLILSKIIY